MKSKNLIATTILICSMATMSIAEAQTTKKISFLMDTKSMEKALYLFDPSATINTKAIRDFKQSYPNVDGEDWYSFKDGFAARFKDNGIQHMITYDRSGNRMFTISNYQEKQLPKEVRGLVKSKYYDYTITLVQEIVFQEQTVYLIQMQDETTWKNVRVADGEMTVIEDFIKG